VNLVSASPPQYFDPTYDPGGPRVCKAEWTSRFDEAWTHGTVWHNINYGTVAIIPPPPEPPDCKLRMINGFACKVFAEMPKMILVCSNSLCVGYTKTGILDGKVLLSFEFVSKCWAAVMMQVDYETLNLRRLNYGCGFVSCVYEMSKMLMGFSNSLFYLSITTGRLNEKVLLSYAFVSTCCVLVVMQFIYEVIYLLRWLCGTDIAYGVLIFKKKSNTLGLRFVLTLSRGDLLQLSWKDHYSSWLCELNPQGISCDEYWLNGAYGFCNIKGAPICKCWHGFEPMFLHDWKMVEWFDGCVKKHWQLCRDEDLFKHFTRITL
jgi:hypothetical protein